MRIPSTAILKLICVKTIFRKFGMKNFKKILNRSKIKKSLKKNKNENELKK